MAAVMNQSNALARAKLSQVKVSVDPQIATAFKAACAASNVSMAAELTRFMVDYSKGTVKRKVAPDYTTRRKRRAVIKRILVELEQLRVAEERLIDNAPDNLQDAPIYETADEYIAIFDDVIGLLEGVMVP